MTSNQFSVAPLHKTIKVATRTSPLARKQVTEVLYELRAYHPTISFEVLASVTKGDLDKKTSLRDLGATDFFTKELDDMVLSGECDIGIHSAKDLPEPLTEGLSVVALTRGVDPRDVLVMRDDVTVDTLPSGAKVATSSHRRAAMIQNLRSDLLSVDIRGNIGERLEQLFNHEVDGVVMAEAALIRLGYTHLNRYFFPEAAAPLQGRLAVVARTGHQEMADLFRPLFQCA